MESAVGAATRRELDARVRAMRPEERVALVAELAEHAIDLYCAANGVDRATARRVFQRQRQAGRQASPVMQGLLE